MESQTKYTQIRGPVSKTETKTPTTNGKYRNKLEENAPERNTQTKYTQIEGTSKVKPKPGPKQPSGTVQLLLVESSPDTT